MFLLSRTIFVDVFFMIVRCSRELYVSKRFTTGVSDWIMMGSSQEFHIFNVFFTGAR